MADMQASGSSSSEPEREAKMKDAQPAKNTQGKFGVYPADE
jgi:hypothetical protein